MPKANYELHYWPGIPGRGEFIRLALEYAGAPYVDVVRTAGLGPMMAYLEGKRGGMLPFAPPFLVHGKLVIAQTANVLQYLAPRHDLVPKSDASRIFAHQLQLTLSDLVVEAHDVHHPIGVDFYYEDQKPEAKRRAKDFVEERLPKFLSYFESVLERGASRYLIGNRLTYIDLSAFQVVSGLQYAFPRAMGRVSPATPRLSALVDRVAGHERLQAYFGSPRRLAFNEQGLFRHYPELDPPEPTAAKRSGARGRKIRQS